MDGGKLYDRIGRILDDLDSPLPGRRRDAYALLQRMTGRIPMEQVMSRFDRVPDGVRPLLIRYLGETGTPAAQRHLLRLIRSDVPRYREGAFRALDRIPRGERIDSMVELLREGNPERRRYAAQELGKSRSSRVVEPLLDSYDEISRGGRVEILKALSRLADPRGIRLARRALSEKDPQTAAEGVRLLGHLKAGTYSRAVVRLRRHPDRRVRRAVCLCLEQLGTRAARRGLIRILREETDEEVRRECARGLASFSGRKVARSLLETAAKDRSVQVRRMAGFSLASLSGAGVRETLRRAGTGADGEIRRTAIELIGLRGEADGFPLLSREMLSGVSMETRVAAAEGLGGLGDPRGIDVLARVLDGPVPLAHAAAQSICRLSAAQGPEALAGFLDPGKPVSGETLVVFAGWLSRVGRVHSLPAEVLAPVRKWTDAPQMALRYLALTILGGAGGPDDLPRVLERVSKGEEEEIRRGALEAGRELLSRHGEVFRQFSRLPVSFGFLCGLLRGMFPPAEERRRWIRFLAGRLEEEDDGRILAVWIAWGDKGPDELVETIGEEEPDAVRAGLLYALDRIGGKRELTAPERERIRRGMRSGRPPVLAAALSAARRLSAEEGLTEGVEAAEGDAPPPLRQRAAELVRGWLT